MPMSTSGQFEMDNNNSHWIVIYSLGKPSAGAYVCVVINCPSVINQQMWEFQPKMVGVYSSYLAPL